MSHNIKQLRPQRNGRYSQGYINTKSCKKLFESQCNKPIIYRSSYEKKFIQWLENNSSVSKWGSECVQISYISPIDDKQHTYYPDFLFVQNEQTILAEIKPANQTRQPSNTLPRDSYAWRTWMINVSKWKAAQEFCERNNMRFVILTERTIDKL